MKMTKLVFIASLCARLAVAGVMLAASQAHAGTDPTFEELLARTNHSVELFWRHVPTVKCTELLTQEKLGNKGKVEYKDDSIFDYLLLTSTKGDQVSLEESRLLRKTVDKAKDRPLLTTSGFSTLLLIFHPAYQSSYRYRPDGQEVVAGKKLIRIRFEHVPGTRSTSALQLRDKVYPLDLQGTAWIDPEDGSIQKITAELKAPMENLNLKAFYTAVTYAPQRFSASPNALWLPASATIDVETARQHWRNVHRFSDYRQFTVALEK